MNMQSGMSFSEVLVSLFLSSLILTVLIQYYLISKQQYNLAEQLLETHFELHWTSELLGDSIRRAGFTPCLGIEQLNLMYGGKKVKGLSLEKQPYPLIQINRMSEHFLKVKAVKNIMQIAVSERVTLQEKYPILIADCEHAEIKYIASVDKKEDESLITFTTPLHSDSFESAYIGEFIQEQWFIKNKALYYKSHQTEEITSLIHSLHAVSHSQEGSSFIDITFGLDDEKKYTMMVVVRGS